MMATHLFGPMLFTPSTMSTSPPAGHPFSWTSQIAGQVPQPSGMWRTSKTATWVVYVLTLLMRTLFRPVRLVAGMAVVWSARRIRVLPCAYVRFCANAVA
jgi:hypothetical protein